MAGAVIAVVGMLFSALITQDAGGLRTWRFSNGAEFPGAAGHVDVLQDGVVRLHFDFTGGGSYVGAFHDFEPPMDLERVTFRIRKPAEAAITLRVIDSTGQGLQEPLVYDHEDWQPVELDMLRFDFYFGGANDGELHPPVKSLGILVERQGLSSLTGDVLIAEVIPHAAGETPGSPGPQMYRGEYVATGFENDEGLWADPPGSLENSVWRVDFSGRGAASLGRSLSLLGQPREISLSVEGGAPGNVLRIRFGSHFQSFERIIGVLDGSAQTFRFPVPPEGYSYSGGENDGVVRPPLRFESLTLERGDGAAAPVMLKLAPLRCHTDISRDAPVTMLAALRPASADTAPGELRATVKIWNLLDSQLEGTLYLTARDWQEEVTHDVSQACALPANGEPVELDFPVTLPEDRNFLEAEFRFEAEGVKAAVARATYTRPLTRDGDATLRPESPWGMGVYLYRYGDHAQMDQIAALAQRAGVKWSREEFSWGAIEKAPGEYDFSFYDVVVDTARRHGISVYGLLAYWSRWTEPYTEKGIEDFCRFARATVRRYKDRVKHWEVYNEPNIFFWSGPKELYPELLTRCYAAIKEEDPKAHVLGISTAGIDTKFIGMCLEKQAPFDILTIHPYRTYLSERVFMRELREVAAQVNGRPVWITEMGWSTHVGGKDERKQAQLLARCYLTAVALRVCQNISWYDFRDDGDNPFYNEHNFGVLRHDMTPKAAYLALARVCRSFADGAPRLLILGGGLMAVGGNGVTALWHPTRYCRVTLQLSGETPRVMNLMGERIEAVRDGDTMSLDLAAQAPVFIRATGLELAGEPEIQEREIERDVIGI